jgi:hypothetical protein
MLIEVLVIASCVNQNGCQDSTHAYYMQSKALQEMNANIERLGREIVRNEEWLVFAATPAYMLFSGQTAQIKLHDNWYMDINGSKQYAGIRWMW